MSRSRLSNISEITDLPEYIQANTQHGALFPLLFVFAARPHEIVELRSVSTATHEIHASELCNDEVRVRFDVVDWFLRTTCGQQQPYYFMVGHQPECRTGTHA